MKWSGTFLIWPRKSVRNPRNACYAQSTHKNCLSLLLKYFSFHSIILIYCLIFLILRTDRRFLPWPQIHCSLLLLTAFIFTKLSYSTFFHTSLNFHSLTTIALFEISLSCFTIHFSLSVLAVSSTNNAGFIQLDIKKSKYAFYRINIAEFKFLFAAHPSFNSSYVDLGGNSPDKCESG